MKNKTILLIVLFLAGAFFTSSLQAQGVTSNAAYIARMDSNQKKRQALQDKYALVFVDCATPEDLKESIEEYGLQDFYVVSEYKKDFGTLNVFYNDQTTPTCHYLTNSLGAKSLRARRQVSHSCAVPWDSK